MELRQNYSLNVTDIENTNNVFFELTKGVARCAILYMYVFIYVFICNERVFFLMVVMLLFKPMPIIIISIYHTSE